MITAVKITAKTYNIDLIWFWGTNYFEAFLSVFLTISFFFVGSFAEADDAIVESDEEVDFTKMDPGNKKGPVSRWDFETQEEYSDYMSNKEALPK